jgi:hypothetical protein
MMAFHALESALDYHDNLGLIRIPNRAINPGVRPLMLSRLSTLLPLYKSIIAASVVINIICLLMMVGKSSLH